MKRKAGFPIEPKNLKTTLGHMESVRSKIAELKKELKNSKSEHEKISQKFDDIKQALFQKNGQIANQNS
jgi:predicted  nucleic acid-binding Zn-ribbon protein